jgi:hypothetical protein
MNVQSSQAYSKPNHQPGSNAQFMDPHNSHGIRNARRANHPLPAVSDLLATGSSPHLMGNTGTAASPAPRAPRPFHLATQRLPQSRGQARPPRRRPQRRFDRPRPPPEHTQPCTEQSQVS